jgi:hypothetical protein
MPSRKLPTTAGMHELVPQGSSAASDRAPSSHSMPEEVIRIVREHEATVGEVVWRKLLDPTAEYLRGNEADERRRLRMYATTPSLLAAKAKWPGDAELAFAGLLLQELEQIRATLLFMGSHEEQVTWSNGYAAGHNVMRLYQQWREEFLLGPYIGPELRSKDAKRSAGQKAGRDRQKRAKENRAHWRKIDVELRLRRPGASKNARAQVIAKQVAGGFFAAKASTISRALEN